MFANAVKKGESFTAIGMRSTRFSSRTTSTSDCSTAAAGTLRSVTNSYRFNSRRRHTCR